MRFRPPNNAGSNRLLTVGGRFYRRTARVGYGRFRDPAGTECRHSVRRAASLDEPSERTSTGGACTSRQSRNPRWRGRGEADGVRQRYKRTRVLFHHDESVAFPHCAWDPVLADLAARVPIFAY